MRLAPALALGLGVLAGCASARPAQRPASVLRLSVDPAPPAQLAPGTLVKVSAVPEPPCQLAWVSGTVKLLGAPVLGFKPDPADGIWRFKTMVPPMTTVPPGHYQVKAWGRSADGAEVDGALDYEVK